MLIVQGERFDAYYFSDLEDSLNVLGLASIMFLLEQINLLQKQD